MHENNQQKKSLFTDTIDTLFSPKTKGGYDKNLLAYDKTDGKLVFVAIFFVILLFLVATIIFYYLILPMQNHVALVITHNVMGALLVGIFPFGLIVLLLKKRKQSVATIGLSSENWFPSVVVGLLIGLAVWIWGNSFFSWGSFTQTFSDAPNWDIIRSILYLLIVVAFVEEIVFRGYMQTRIHGLIKSTFLGVMAVGLIFAVIHFPFHFVLSGLSLGEYSLYFFINSLPHFMVLHALFWFLYRRYNSLIAPIIIHFFWNWRA